MSTEKARILYIDDEANNLTGFKATFRRDYKIVTAISAMEAKDILREQEFELIISDERMPEISGVEFFKSIIDEYPKPVRMLLTGYADIEAVIKAINEGHVYRYVTKPWDENDMRMTIDNALQFYNTQNELRERNVELEKAYNELEKFVYSASHDLRAPLASILGIVQLAKLDDLNPEQDDYMNKIETSVNKLDMLLQNIISYYRSARLKADHVEVDLKKLVDNALESFEYYENAKSINFKVEVNQTAPFVGDETRMQIVLNNVVSNAIKYQRPDEPNKEVSINIDADDKRAIIKISDNGIGISDDEMENVFTMFYRSAVKNAGSGIGLYIVKETIDKLSGSVNIDSTPGQGTTFTIEIPNQA